MSTGLSARAGANSRGRRTASCCGHGSGTLPAFLEGLLTPEKLIYGSWSHHSALQHDAGSMSPEKLFYLDKRRGSTGRQRNHAPYSAHGTPTSSRIFPCHRGKPELACIGSCQLPQASPARSLRQKHILVRRFHCQKGLREACYKQGRRLLPEYYFTEHFARGRILALKSQPKARSLHMLQNACCSHPLCPVGTLPAALPLCHPGIVPFMVAVLLYSQWLAYGVCCQYSVSGKYAIIE